MPLTTTGICVQILSSVNAFREHRSICTSNDCKVVVNHLIRKFSEPLARQGLQVRRQSVVVRDVQGLKPIVDHAVPVIVLMDEMFRWDQKSLEISTENLQMLEKFLSDSLVLVEVSRDEDRVLSRNGLQREMPAEWRVVGNPLFKDPLARYKISGIELA